MWPSPAGREASSGGSAPPYVRHRPQQTLLYQLIEEHYPALKAHLAARGAELPGSVQREFDEHLKCGRLEHGFLRVRRDSCHAEQLVAFSCKRRGFCPSCGARRMAESAALLIDEVFPEQPVRQWVLSVPYPLRFLFASRPAVMGQVLGIVYRCIATHLIKKAGLSRKTAQAGAVALIQRFGSALNLNVHFHMLFLDGVYIDRPDGSLRFRWVKAPTSTELAGLPRLWHGGSAATWNARECWRGRVPFLQELSSWVLRRTRRRQLMGLRLTSSPRCCPHGDRRPFRLGTSYCLGFFLKLLEDLCLAAHLD